MTGAFRTAGSGRVAPESRPLVDPAFQTRLGAIPRDLARGIAIRMRDITKVLHDREEPNASESERDAREAVISPDSPIEKVRTEACLAASERAR